MSSVTFKAKALVAALALAGTGSASAAIAQFSTGNGGLFLTVRDNTNQVSYVRDLGMTMDTFLASASSPLTFNADANMTSFLGAGTSSYSWAVEAGDLTASVPAAAGDLRYLSTSNSGSGSIGSITNQELNNFSIVDGKVTSYNGAIGAGASATCASTASCFTDAGQDSWGNSTSKIDSTAAMGTAQDFWLLKNSGDPSNFFTASAAVTTALQAGQWLLASNGNLTYSVAGGTAPVPLPPAVWLLGSALVGMVGVSRRKVNA